MREQRRVPGQLLPVLAAEGAPAGGIVGEPSPEAIGRSEVTQPLVDRRACSTQGAWPEAIHENPHPVMRGDRLVDVLDADRRGGA